MKKIVSLLLVILSVSISVTAQNKYTQFINKADSLYRAKAYKESTAAYLSAFKIVKTNKSDLYNAACAAALAGDRSNAFKFLNASIALGWVDLAHLSKDTDLDSLRDSKAWEQAVVNLKTQLAKIEANYNHPVKEALEKVYETDQGIRLQYTAAFKKYAGNHPTVDSLGKLMMHHDSLNTQIVSKILDQLGWLGEDKIGQKANQTLFLVIQHAGLKVQQKYLPMLRAAVKEGKAAASSLALMEDRVALREGRKQIYGSQMSSNPEQPGQYYLSPLVDPEHVDERRASVGLGKLADYLKNWQLTWDVADYQKNLPKYEEWQRRIKW